MPTIFRAVHAAVSAALLHAFSTAFGRAKYAANLPTIDDTDGPAIVAAVLSALVHADQPNISAHAAAIQAAHNATIDSAIVAAISTTEPATHAAAESAAIEPAVLAALQTAIYAAIDTTHRATNFQQTHRCALCCTFQGSHHHSPNAAR